MKRNDIQRKTAGRRRVSCRRVRATLYEGEGTAIDRGHSPHSAAHKDSPSATNPGSAMTCADNRRQQLDIFIRLVEDVADNAAVGGVDFAGVEGDVDVGDGVLSVAQGCGDCVFGYVD